MTGSIHALRTVLVHDSDSEQFHMMASASGLILEQKPMMYRQRVSLSFVYEEKCSCLYKNAFLFVFLIHITHIRGNQDHDEEVD